MQNSSPTRFAVRVLVLVIVLIGIIFLNTNLQETRSSAERAEEGRPTATLIESNESSESVLTARKITKASHVIKTTRSTTKRVTTTTTTTTTIKSTYSKPLVRTQKEKVTTKKSVSKTKKKSKSKTKTYIGKFKLTFYCDCATCNGSSSGLTASGARLQPGVTIATNPSEIPLGSKVYIEGFGNRIAQDTGGFGSNTIDICVESHARAYELGVQYKKVYIYK